MDQPIAGTNGGDEQRGASVSSLASRFEQLAASSGSTSTSSQARLPCPPSRTGSASSLSAPPAPRPKPVVSRSFLQEQAARLEARDGRGQLQAGSAAPLPVESAFVAGEETSRSPLPAASEPEGPAYSGLPSAAAPRRRTSSQQSRQDPQGKAPPPIPLAARPVSVVLNSRSTPAFAYNLSPPQLTTDTIAPRAPSPKRSRTPPPVPTSRRSRPDTPSTSYENTSPSRSSMLVEVDRQPSVLQTTTQTVTSGVSAIAHEFGHAKPSKSYTTSPSGSCSRQTTPESRSPSGQPGQPFDPHSASRALQNMVTDGDANDQKPSNDVPPSQPSHPSSLRPLPAISSTSSARNASPPAIASRSVKASSVAAGVSGTASEDSHAGSMAPPPRKLSVPPALPHRGRSNSVQTRDNPFEEPSVSLAPPLPGRSGPDVLAGRPRAATASELSTNNRQKNGMPPHKGTIPIPVTQAKDNAKYIPPPPPIRSVQAGESRAATPTTAAKIPGTHDLQSQRNAANGTLDSSSSGSEDDASDDRKISTEMPDASFANRRPPIIIPERKLFPKHSVYAFAVHGRYAISATTHLRVWDTWTGETTGVITLQGENKIVAVEFVFTDSERGRDGRIAWAGSKDGNLFEVDIQTLRVIETKTSGHSSPISVIYRAPGNRMVTVCESGKVQIWANDEDPDAAPSLSSTPRTHRLLDKHCFLKCFGDQLWSCHGPVRQSTISSHLSSNAARSPTVRVYKVNSEGATSLTTRAMHPLDNGCPVGPVMAGTMIPYEPNLVYLAHETGHISIWNKADLQCLDVVRVSPYAITALEGVYDMLWSGNREGSIYVYDTKHTPWKVAKAWKASDEPICGLQVDLATLGTSDMLHVASYGRENLIMWDGLLEVDWLEHAMLKRETEFSTYRDIKAFICSWNIGSSKPADLQNDASSINFLSDALQSSLAGAASRQEPPELIVFGLQEVVDLENKKLTAKNMILGRKKSDALFQDQVSHQYMRWHDRLVQAVRTAMPADSPYYLLHAENLVGLQTLIFAKCCEKPNISDAAKISVKTGMGGRYGNKGAILARFVIDDSSICFLNCHLAAGQRATRQRNKDLIDILENKAAFLHPSNALPGVYIGGSGQTVFEHEICFLSGDLNYRVSLTRSIVSANIRSNNLKLLLEHDQLAKEMKTNQSFRLRSFREADISFPPTYKFDPGTNNYDSSAKERIPAWCDRILYRVHEPSLKEEKIRPIDYRSWSATPSDHKPISGLFAIRVKKVDRDRRLMIREEMETAWKAKAKDILVEARRFHGIL